MKVSEFRKLIREEIENVLGKNINESSINTYYKDLIIQQINKRLFNIFDRDGMMESEYQDLQNYLKMLEWTWEYYNGMCKDNYIYYEFYRIYALYWIFFYFILFISLH